MHEFHMRFFQFTPSFAMIAGGAGGHNIIPGILSPKAPWYDVVDRKRVIRSTAILTGIIIAAKNFASSEFDMWPWPVDHCF